MASAIELMWPGVPVTAWATISPRRSKTPAERSPASRTIDVNEVRWSASACSLTTPMSRFQQTSSVTGSKFMARLTPRASRLDHQRETRVDAATSARADDRGRLALLDDGRSRELRAGRERVPVVDRRVHVRLGLGEPRAPRALQRAAYAAAGWCRRLHRHPRRRARRGDAPVQRLERHALGQTVIERAIRGFEAR